MKRLYNFLLGVRCDKLGKLEPGYVATSDRYKLRKHEANAMPEQWFRQSEWAASFSRQLGLLTYRHAAKWITAHRELPRVKGNLR